MRDSISASTRLVEKTGNLLQRYQIVNKVLLVSPCAFKQHIVRKIESRLGQCHSKYMWIFLFIYLFCCAYVLVWEEFTELGPLFSSTVVFGFVGFTYCMTSFFFRVTLKHSLSFDEDVFFCFFLAFVSFLNCCMLFGTLSPKITKNKISFNTYAHRNPSDLG